MGGLVPERNSKYVRYEELILQRDRLKKEAFEANQEYIRVFGDRICRLFACKVSCIKKKKMISYCQAVLNHGGKIEQDKLQEYLNKEMADYQKQLDELIEAKNAANKGELISEYDMLEIRRLYRSLVKRMHPDRNPQFAEDEDIMAVWNEIAIAYTCNDLKRLRELEVLANSLLKGFGEQNDIDIPDIEDRIEEIEAEMDTIRNTDPYLYHEILKDPVAVREKEQSLDEEIQEYQEYEQQLEEVLDGIMAEGVKITWTMN